jgi:ribosomal protein S18 acetylase RimI-like enzyme
LWNDEIGNTWVTAQNIAPHYDRVKNDENYKTFVAVIDTDVVGFVASVQAYAVGFEERQMQITGIAVKSDKHNEGIGTNLIRFIEKYAQDKCVVSIYLCCGVNRTNAHAFYKRNGYDNHSWCFGKKL